MARLIAIPASSSNEFDDRDTFQDKIHHIKNSVGIANIVNIFSVDNRSFFLKMMGIRNKRIENREVPKVSPVP